jgi:hypothetical protein
MNNSETNTAIAKTTVNSANSGETFTTPLAKLEIPINIRATLPTHPPLAKQKHAACQGNHTDS